jgi:hypothetical protein
VFVERASREQRNRNMRVLFLDDDEERAARLRKVCPEAVWVQTAEECIECLSEDWDVIRLDHDLGGEIFVNSDRADCGMEVVRYLVENHPNHLQDTVFIVHTHNQAAAEAMVNALSTAGYDCTHFPFQYID